MKQIQTDIFSFERLRASDAIYVDKTEYVHRLVTSAGNTYFLSRPRRFGKSLLVSTLKAYFEGRKDLFEGLKIEGLQPGAWMQYPVIHLDMAQASSREGIDATKRKMQNVMREAATRCDVAIENDLPSIMLNRLINELNRKTGKQVVVLVDEYDKPILDALHSDFAEEAVNLSQDFYQELKSNNAILRFVFLTGVSKFAHSGLFSGFNNPTDISQMDEYAHLLGYTEAELLANFNEHIDFVANKLQLSHEELLANIKYWYDGHRFALDPVTLYNPVSIGQFFIRKIFLNFWVDTGTPRFLVEEMRHDPFTLEPLLNRWHSFEQFGKFDIQNLSPMALAIQTGYLTISDVKYEDGVPCVRYDYPNNEIRQSWSKELMRLAFHESDDVLGYRERLRDAIAGGDCQDLMQCLQSIFAGASYENLGTVTINEGYYRNMIYMLFSAFNIRNVAEEQNSMGRIDFVASATNHAYVMELKVRRNKKSTNQLLSDAIHQMRDRHYGDKYRLESRQVHLIAAVFDSKTHTLEDWRIE